jgi:septal ring factor EnvC (AmiA/AmiB activator)
MRKAHHKERKHSSPNSSAGKNRTFLSNQSRKDKHMFRNFKRMTAALVFLLGVPMLLSSTAQTQPQRVSVEEHIKILKNKLKLGDEQTKKVTAILEDQREEITTAMNDNRGDRQAMYAAVQEITKKTDNKIKEILTEKQVKAYDKTIKDRQEQVSRRMKSSNK